MSAIGFSVVACTTRPPSQPPVPQRPSVRAAPRPCKQCECGKAPLTTPQPSKPGLHEVVRTTAAAGTITAAAGALLAAAELAMGVPTCCLVPTMVGQLESVGGHVANLAATGSLDITTLFAALRARVNRSAESDQPDP